MTIRGLVKKELVSKGYPIEKSHYSKSRIKGMSNKFVEQKGIELVRSCSDMYKPEMHKQGWIETLAIYTNGFIGKDEMQKIVDKCMEEYNPFATEVKISIF